MTTDSSFIPTVWFKPGVSVVDRDGGCALSFRQSYFDLRSISPGVRRAIECLVTGGKTERQLSVEVLTQEGMAGASALQAHLAQFRALGFLRDTLNVEGRPCVSLVPMVLGRNARVPPADERRYRVSRFAVMRRVDDELVVETATDTTSVTAHDWRTPALLAAWGTSRTIDEAAKALPVVPEEITRTIWGFLAAASVLVPIGDDGLSSDERNQALTQWDFHDLYFHTRTRMGRHGNLLGAAFPFANAVPAPPVARPTGAGAFPLFRPTGMNCGMSIGEAIETRRSIRTYGVEPISLEQVATFLYHVARIRSTSTHAAPDGRGGVARYFELSSRPYPGGGAIHELEVYLTIDRCNGLEPGLYHYDPMQHALEKLSDANRQTAALLQDACRSAAIPDPPQVLITLTSRFERMSWKYASIPYAATLKNVGVLLQTMYLVATAMRLAPCALGNGNSESFAKAAGTDYFVESSVGEFMLGSLPDESSRPQWIKDSPVRPNLPSGW